MNEHDFKIRVEISEMLVRLLTGSATEDDINYFTQIKTINELFFNKN